MTYDQTYEAHDDYFGSDPNEVLVRYNDLIRNLSPVLDIGAGQGRNSFYLAARGMQVHAVDLSPIGIELIERISRERKYEITAWVCDFLTHPFEVAGYSAVLLFGLMPLLSCDEIRKLNQKTKEILEPGVWSLLRHSVRMIHRMRESVSPVRVLGRTHSSIQIRYTPILHQGN